MQGWASVNGELSLFKDVKIAAADRGFLYGDQIIETMLGVQTQIIMLHAHLDRLWESLASVHIDPGISKAQLARECKAVVARAGFQRAMIRLMVTRGVGVGMFTPPQGAQRYIFVWPAPEDEAASHVETSHDVGIRCEVIRRDPHQHTRLKTGFYLPAVHHYYAALASPQACFDDLIWASDDGQLLEAATANVFFIQSGHQGESCLVCPDHAGVFAGLTGEQVRHIAQRLGMEVRMKPVYCHELHVYSECFLGSSVRGLRRVGRLGDHEFKGAAQPSIFALIKASYDHEREHDSLGQGMDPAT